VIELRSVMTAFPHSIDADEMVSEARAQMADHGIRHLPVTRGGDLVGIVSERDLRLLIGVGSGLSSEFTTRVGDVCGRDVYVVDLHEPLAGVLSHMVEQHLGSALVTRKGKLVGIFTSTDACRCFAEYLRGREPSDDDAA